jgi:hypothetical protein
MSRRGCSVPASASVCDPHRAPITSRVAQVIAEAEVLQQIQHTPDPPEVGTCRTALWCAVGARARWLAGITGGYLDTGAV